MTLTKNNNIMKLNRIFDESSKFKRLQWIKIRDLESFNSCGRGSYWRTEKFKKLK